jgi:hypothetical protein
MFRLTRISFLALCALTISLACDEIQAGNALRPNQHTQSLSFFGPSTWNPGTTVTVDVVLTFAGYNAFSFEYWLQAQSAIAPYLTITGVQYFTFTDQNSNAVGEHFNSTSGASPGYLTETHDLGASVTDPTTQPPVAPGSYLVTRITLAVGTGACALGGQSFTIQSTTVAPRISEVTDSEFGDNIINPGGTLTFTIGSPACTVISQVSRKSHGTAGPFDINLPLTGTPGIECRSGGPSSDHSIVVTFSSNVAVNGNPQAAVTLGTGMIGSDGNSNGGMVLVNGNTVTIPLTSVGNEQTINVTLFGVNYGAGNMNLVIPMSLLLGDTTANGVVNASDITQTKSKVGQSVNVSNFREDVTVGGAINGADVSLVKASGHTALP